MYRSIMVPLDGSPFGEHALPIAISIARRTGAAIQLVHVRVPPEPVYYIDGEPIYDAPDVANQERDRTYLEGLAQRLTDAWHLTITATLLEGVAAEALSNHATLTSIDLIVMTTHGRGPLSRFWLGSVADSLVRQVPVPVLLVRPQEHAPDLTREQVFKHVLIPLDGSALAEDVLERAVAFGKPMQTEYTLLQAINPVMLGYVPGAYAPALDEQTFEEWQAEGRAYLEQIAARLRAEGLKVHVSIVIDQPAVAILDYARQHEIDVIAMATHGRGGVSRVLLGSVADKVVRGGNTPVLLYRPYAAGQTVASAEVAGRRRFDEGYGE